MASTLNQRQLLTISADIVNGMVHLSSQKVCDVFINYQMHCLRRFTYQIDDICQVLYMYKTDIHISFPLPQRYLNQSACDWLIE